MYTEKEERQVGNELRGFKEGIDRYTKKITIRSNKIFITIDSAPLRQELSYGREKILKNLNEIIGEEFLVDIIIR